MPGVPEPVPKAHQALYVKAAQDLHWLSEHDMLEPVAQFLASLRAAVEHEDKLPEPGQFQVRASQTVTANGRSREWYSPDGKVVVRAEYQTIFAEPHNPVGEHVTLIQVFEEGELVGDPLRARALAEQLGIISTV